MLELSRRFWGDEAGATVIEYALIGSGIALAIISVLGSVGVKLNAVFTSIDSGFS